jgi:hypothetical protein
MQPSIALRMFQPTKRMMAVPVCGRTLQLTASRLTVLAFAEGGAKWYVIRSRSKRQKLALEDPGCSIGIRSGLRIDTG